MNDLVANPFGQRSAAASSSTAMTVSSREVAEVQTRYLMAKKFPRDLIVVADNIINAFSRKDLAEQAEYEYARGGEKISGPTIRTAEAIAQQFGNIDFGFKEVSRGESDDGVRYSDVETWAIDLQSGARRSLTFIVRHWRDTKKGGYAITDERDISELIGNQAQRRVRGCILAVVPGDITELAMKQVAVTMSANADTTPEGIARMVKAFARFDVTPQMIEKRIQRRLDAIQPAQVVSLLRVFNSLKDGMSVVEDWFELDAAATPATKTTTTAEMRAKTKDKATPAATSATQATTEQAAASEAGSGGETIDRSTGEISGKPADAGGAPIVTFAEVQDGLNKASTLEQLDDAAALITAVGNRAQQKELNTAYAELRKKLGGD